MTVQELYEHLERLIEDGNGDCDVRLATQPNYPFEYGIDRIELVNAQQDAIDEIDEVIAGGSLTPDEVTEANSERERYDSQENVHVYLGEGSYIGYLPGAVSKALGWR